MRCGWGRAAAWVGGAGVGRHRRGLGGVVGRRASVGRRRWGLGGAVAARVGGAGAGAAAWVMKGMGAAKLGPAMWIG